MKIQTTSTEVTFESDKGLLTVPLTTTIEFRVEDPVHSKRIRFGPSLKDMRFPTLIVISPFTETKVPLEISPSLMSLILVRPINPSCHATIPTMTTAINMTLRRILATGFPFFFFGMLNDLFLDIRSN